MRFDLDARHDAFHVAAIIEQRREAGPALLAHAIAFVQNHDAAQDHGAHQRRRHIAQTARAFDYRRDQQIFRARIQRRLHDEDVAPHALGRRISQRRFADARLADQPRIHRHIVLGHDHPRGQQLPHEFFLPDPADRQFIGMGEVKTYSFNLNCHEIQL